MSRSQNYESRKRLSGTAFDHRNDYGIPHTHQRAQIHFDIAEFYPVSAELDLFIDAAFKEKKTVTEPAEVACFVCSKAAMVAKSARCKIRPPDITRADIRPCNDDFAALSGRQLLAIFIGHENLRSRHHATHRQRRIHSQN